MVIKMIDSERLITVIENYHSIWNTSISEYHNKTIKDNSWNSVCQDVVLSWFELSPEEKNDKLTEVKKKWNNIRDYYKKELEQQKNVGTGQPAKKRKKYVYAEILEFLRPIFEHRKTSSNYENVEENGRETSSVTASLTTSTTSTSVDQKKQKNTGKLNNFESSIIKALEKRSSKEDPRILEDPDLLFLKSLLPDIQRMTASQKVDFKIGIMQLLKTTKNSGFQPQFKNNYGKYINSPVYRHSKQKPSQNPVVYPASPIVLSRTPGSSATRINPGSTPCQDITSKIINNNMSNNLFTEQYVFIKKEINPE